MFSALKQKSDSFRRSLSGRNSIDSTTNSRNSLSTSNNSNSPRSPFSFKQSNNSNRGGNENNVRGSTSNNKLKDLSQQNDISVVSPKPEEEDDFCYLMITEINSLKDFLKNTLDIVDNLDKIRDSKHYKPNEHYYYFTQEGLIGYMKDCGFDLLEYNFDETKSGRSNIIACCFIKNV